MIALYSHTLSSIKLLDDVAGEVQKLFFHSTRDRIAVDPWARCPAKKLKIELVCFHLGTETSFLTHLRLIQIREYECNKLYCTNRLSKANPIVLQNINVIYGDLKIILKLNLSNNI